MVSQHGDAREPADEDDKLEGALHFLFLSRTTLPFDAPQPQSKLATLRNANSEDEVDDSMLQLGLLAYPVLQAADILLYKCAPPCPLLLSSSLTNHPIGPRTSPSVTTKLNTSNFAATSPKFSTAPTPGGRRTAKGRARASSGYPK